MATKNPRLNVVIEPKMYDQISGMAKSEGLSMSLYAKELLKEALELHEDAYWNYSAVKREKTYSSKKALSHEDVWEK